MLAEVKTLIGRINDDGVFGEAAFFEVIKQASDTLIHGTDTAEIVLQVALGLPAGDVLIAELARTHCGNEGLVRWFVGGVPGVLLLG